ncbi:TIGR02646 family protein [Clostridium botulinum]|nr:TIGR02646 family protein [Clostridium botulinum]NFK69224.1 TIGR02646 family protein [Clostridium botulinum]NFK97573.1 TIGR02646 family protein [Clostridium botulinum]
MIKIKRTSKPIELTEEIEKDLTEKFKKNGDTAVWRKKYIVENLFKMSNGKCCYCETKLKEEGKSMHVEHYHYKDKYPDEVVKWENLLPSCGRCNINKGTHDTKIEPIINPTIDNPKDYFYFYNYRYKSKNRNKLAKDTIDVLYLNDTTTIVQVRFKICNAIIDKLSEIEELLRDYVKKINTSTRRKNKIINGVKDILKYSQPTEEYSAIMATTIINDDNYKYIKIELLNLGLWDLELEDLEKEAINIMFDTN